jgi:hypothetical protein
VFGETDGSEDVGSEGSGGGAFRFGGVGGESGGFGGGGREEMIEDVREEAWVGGFRGERDWVDGELAEDGGDARGDDLGSVGLLFVAAAVEVRGFVRVEVEGAGQPVLFEVRFGGPLIDADVIGFEDGAEPVVVGVAERVVFVVVAFDALHG